MSIDSFFLGSSETVALDFELMEILLHSNLHFMPTCQLVKYVCQMSRSYIAFNQLSLEWNGMEGKEKRKKIPHPPPKNVLKLELANVEFEGIVMHYCIII